MELPYKCAQSNTHCDVVYNSIRSDACAVPKVPSAATDSNRCNFAGTGDNGIGLFAGIEHFIYKYRQRSWNHLQLLSLLSCSGFDIQCVISQDIRVNTNINIDI